MVQETAYTPEQVKNMGLDELCPLLEKKLGRQLDGGTLMLLAMCHGGGSVQVVNLNDSSKSGEERLNYEELARILNGPDGEWIKAYTGPKVIVRDPEHFVQTFLFALSVSPRSPEEREKLGYRPGDLTPIQSLVGCFAHLDRVAKNYDRTGYHFHVSPERPYSFYFVCKDANDQCIYNGGIICHGAGEVFAVELTPRNGIHWSIHT